MATVVTGKNKVYKEICDALGLKHVQRLDIHMAFDEIATITVKYFPETDGVQQLIPILKRFVLVERQINKVKLATP